MVARLAHTQQVAGSSPALATNIEEEMVLQEGIKPTKYAIGEFEAS